MVKTTTCSDKLDYKTKEAAMQEGRVQISRFPTLRLFVYLCGCEQWHLSKAIARGSRRSVSFKMYEVEPKPVAPEVDARNATITDLMTKFNRRSDVRFE